MGESVMGTPEFDAEMNRIDRIDRVHKFFESIGASYEQAATIANSNHVEKFKWDGAVLTLQGKAVKEADVRAFFTSNKLDFLLPAENTPLKKIDVDAALLAAAKAGDWTAEGKLFRILHGDKPKTAAAAAETKAELAALLAGKTADADTAPRDDKGRFVADDASNKTPKAKDHKSNPFWRGSWNISAQGKLLRAIGAEKTAAIAASVGSKIGATKPNLDY
jgi:hypothetical protein